MEIHQQEHLSAQSQPTNTVEIYLSTIKTTALLLKLRKALKMEKNTSSMLTELTTEEKTTPYWEVLQKLSIATEVFFRADVNGDGVITEEDVSLTLSKSTGEDMSQTPWIESPYTGDVNCDGQTTTADALLLSKKVNGEDMSQTPWCLEE